MKVFEAEPEFHKTQLENGVRVVTERHPMSRAVSAGVFVDSGTRDEPASLVGAAHFIEHLVFKGTKRRTAFDIVRSLEAVGGELNAYTSREYTCFHATSLHEHVGLSIDVLMDLVSAAQFSQDDFVKEKQVILQEIDMAADQLEEYIFDLYFENAYVEHELGRPILGTQESLANISRQQIYDFYHHRYQGKNLIVSVAGDVDHQEIVDLVAKATPSKVKAFERPKRVKPKPKGFVQALAKNSEQVHMLLGYPSESFKGKRRFDSYIVNAWLGGGMTSRLYQVIREEKGWAYSVYSYLQSFTDSGLIMIYAGTSPKLYKKVKDLMLKEINNLVKQGVRKKDLDLYKTQVKGQILLGADDIENRMTSLGVNEMVFGRYRPVEYIIDEIDRVSRDSIQEYLEKYFTEKNLGILMLGDFKGL